MACITEGRQPEEAMDLAEQRYRSSHLSSGLSWLARSNSSRVTPPADGGPKTLRRKPGRWSCLPFASALARMTGFVTSLRSRQDVRKRQPGLRLAATCRMPSGSELRAVAL